MKQWTLCSLVFVLHVAFNVLHAQSTSILHYDVRARVDSVWGNGYPAQEELRVFDSLWTLIDRNFACFQNLDLDWNAVREKYRPEIARGVSRGRFGAIISQFTILLKEPHTSFQNFRVSGDINMLKRGVPLMSGGDGRICGASLMPLADSTLVVYAAQPDHPLGLSPGDVVLGYDGIRIPQLARYLSTVEIPLYSASNFGGCESACTYNRLTGAGGDWHLFDTIDIVKYPRGDTLHLSTHVLDTLDISVRVSGQYTEQMPIPGIPYPRYPRVTVVQRGIVEGTNVGYIYVWDWFDGFSSPKFYNAIDSLVRIDHVSGLILDFRYNHGGYLINADLGLGILFKSAPPPFMLAMRASSTDHFLMGPGDGWLIDRDTTRSFDKPIAVLTSPHTISAGEIVARQFKEHPFARFFGQPTAGGYASSEFVQIDSMVAGTYACYNGYLQRPGSTPQFLTHSEFPVDERVWMTVDEAARGEDAVVNAALRWIRSVTNVAAEDRSSVPMQYALKQNYPNPFNPSTTIAFSLPSKSHVSLKIYDAIGRQVAELASDELPAGNHTRQWNAAGFPSGVYFYRLQAGPFTEAKKLMLIR